MKNKLSKLFFFDTEFIEEPCFIDLISIGIVSENNECLYLVNKECNLSNANQFVREKVLNKMPEFCKKTKSFKNAKNVLTRKQIAERILNYIGNFKPEFWAYYADYDWVCFCWLFGSMIDLPKGWPKYCKDLKQEVDRLGIRKINIQQENEHNALDDAKWNKKLYEAIQLYI